MIDARNNQVYCGLFDDKHKLIKDYMANDIKIIINNLPKDNVTFVGDGAILHKNLLEGNISKENNIHAINIGICAYNKFNEGISETADSIVPMYLRKSQAERMKEKNE